jgi:hypothetical protein
MKVQLDNILMSSMLMWMDHVILKKGEAYKNFSSQFYPVSNIYNGFYTYGLPFKQVVCDSSISGANILSGVYVNNNFKTIGQNNLTGISPQNGQVYFTSGQGTNNISGNYAVKDFNLYLTNQPEEEILFESQYQARPKTTQTPTGLAIEAITYPCIFLKNNGGIKIADDNAINRIENGGQLPQAQRIITQDDTSFAQYIKAGAGMGFGSELGHAAGDMLLDLFGGE